MQNAFMYEVTFFLIFGFFLLVRYNQVRRELSLKNRQDLIDYMSPIIQSEDSSDELKQKLVGLYNYAPSSWIGLGLLISLPYMLYTIIFGINNKINGLSASEQEIHSVAIGKFIKSNFFAGFHWYLVLFSILGVCLLLTVMIIGAFGFMNKITDAMSNDINNLMKLGNRFHLGY